MNGGFGLVLDGSQVMSLKFLNLNDSEIVGYIVLSYKQLIIASIQIW